MERPHRTPLLMRFVSSIVAWLFKTKQSTGMNLLMMWNGWVSGGNPIVPKILSTSPATTDRVSVCWNLIVKCWHSLPGRFANNDTSKLLWWEKYTTGANAMKRFTLDATVWLIENAANACKLPWLWPMWVNDLKKKDGCQTMMREMVLRFESSMAYVALVDLST